MTDTQGQEQSEFNTRADNAGLAIKDQLGRQLSAMTGQQVVLPPSPVAVGNDGQPVGPLPPEGSYARDQLTQYQQQAAQNAQLHAQVQQPGLPQAPVLNEPPPPQQEPQEQISQRAQERIASLIEQLRTQGQENQLLQQQQTTSARTVEEVQAQLTASRQQMDGLLQEHMEHLEPEMRQQVLSDARLKQAVAESERRILGQVGPKLQDLQLRNDQLEKVRISGTYQGYDPTVHDDLIDHFRKGNPNCSIEQAFRAVATPEELSVSGVGRANAPPPTVPPGSGALSPRYLPTQAEQQDPLTEMRADANRAAELAASSDPNDQKLATALWHKNLSQRLGLDVPG